MNTLPTLAAFLLLLGLGFFFGLAFEEFHAQGGEARPGGVRSFPLLALAGALLYRLDTAHLLPLTAGLLALAGWLAVYYWRHVAEVDPEGRPNIGLMVPICNVLAYLLGPTALAGPPWVAVGVTVVAVLLLTAREELHRFARGLQVEQIVTAGKFLILTGLVLPFLPNEPMTRFSELTPHQVWLAVIAVSGISYASYLLQRYVARSDTGLWIALLGGLYSSTATTVVLAKRVRTEPEMLHQAQTGIVLATSVMYVRLLVIVGIFDLSIARALAPAMLILAGAGIALGATWYWRGAKPAMRSSAARAPTNPLELTTALIFAALFVGIAFVVGWVREQFGLRGLFLMAMIVGAADTDPFVLSIATGGVEPLSASYAAAMILIAASSNNVLKAVYAIALAGARAAAPPATALGILALGGGIAALWMTAGH
jgi:uncharacterized membrane protein (DUF4010 family)